MLKWYLRIYFFIEYLKCVWKSNCIWIIRNDSKKKSEDRVPGFRFGLQVRSGTVQQHGPSQVSLVGIDFLRLGEDKLRLGEG